ncbi:MAG TPA: hypothetical protein VFK57_12200 [Vicinamibacterales bacterium]|nr:hypothetical protein [Vicinamibacterales bacterium]
MTRIVAKAAVTALISGLLGAAWVAVLYAWHPALRIEFDRDLPRNVSGIYGPERDEATRLTFAWTGADAVVRLPGLDRTGPWIADVRVRGARAGNNPTLAVLADGVVLATRELSAGWTDLRIPIPPRPDRRGLVLGLRSSTTIVPGPADPRALGVMLDRLVVAPERVVLVPRPALEAAAIAAAPIGAALAVLGVTASAAIGGAVLLSAGGAAIVARGFGPFTDFPDRAVTLGFAIGIALGAIALAFRLRGGKPRNTARFAIAFSAAALFLKLLVLLHPDMPIGDAMFHAHRFQGVLAGQWYFTSTAPGGYLFPYPPGLYVFSAAFADLVRRGAGDVILLRVVTTTVDVVCAALLYTVVAAAWRDRLAAAIGVAMYHLLPATFAVLTTGNLTNAFAQSLALGALVLAGYGAVRLDRVMTVLLLTVVLAAAYLSHTSTAAILGVAALATAALMAVRGGAALRSTAIAIAIGAVVAALAATAIYYAHFADTYRSEFARIAQETATNAADAGGRTAGNRLAGVPYSVRIHYGVPALLLAAFGALRLFRRGADALTLTLGGWAGACAIFLAIGILTPVDMRYYLAAAPVVALAAAYGASSAWGERPPASRMWWRTGAAALLAGTIWTGFGHWWQTLG